MCQTIEEQFGFTYNKFAAARLAGCSLSAPFLRCTHACDVTSAVRSSSTYVGGSWEGFQGGYLKDWSLSMVG